MFMCFRFFKRLKMTYYGTMVYTEFGIQNVLKVVFRRVVSIQYKHLKKVKFTFAMYCTNICNRTTGPVIL